MESLNNRINFSTFKEVEKAYQEGIYSDTPANRKLGRVGMTYTAYAEKVKKEKAEESKIESDQMPSDKNKPEKKSEKYLKDNFSNFKEGDIIFLDKNHKVGAGNYKVNSIRKQGSFDVVDVEGENGIKATFTMDYLLGREIFKDFKIKDVNYSLQPKKETENSSIDYLQQWLNSYDESSYRIGRTKEDLEAEIDDINNILNAIDKLPKNKISKFIEDNNIDSISEFKEELIDDKNRLEDLLDKEYGGDEA